MTILTAEVIIKHTKFDGINVTKVLNVLGFKEFTEIETELLSYNVIGLYQIGLRSNVLTMAFDRTEDVSYIHVNIDNNDSLRLYFSFLVNEYISEILTLSECLAKYPQFNNLDILAGLFKEHQFVDEVVTAIEQTQIIIYSVDKL